MTLIHKRGDSFILSNVQLLDGVGAPINLAGYTIESQLRDQNDALVAEFVATIAADGLSYELVAETSGIQNAGDYYMDIQYTDSLGRTFSTETFIARINPDITRAEVVQ